MTHEEMDIITGEQLDKALNDYEKQVIIEELADKAGEIARSLIVVESLLRSLSENVGK